VASALALVVTACGDDSGSSDAGATLLVFGATSLTDAFTEIAEAFEAQEPGTTLDLNFAASSSLREQILEGAPADVFASADAANVDALVEAGEAADPEGFATNRITIAVPDGNPAGIAGLEDFADGDLLIGLCAEEVPCGNYGREVLANAGISPAIDTNEPDVGALRTKIEAGELDAGLVYETDVQAAGGALESVSIPDEVNVLAVYPIVTLDASDDSDVAAAFVAFVLSADGQAILESYGFGPP
jgi:molybdate transport system substrate-binding protein